MTLFRTPGRRGRPRKAKDQENAGEEHRRLQLRKAQTSFRARKQQEQKARDEQLAILEATVDKLSQAFLELMDDIINSEACKQDSGVLGKLATVAAQVLALSRDKSQDDPFAELSNRNQPAISSAPEPSHANLVRLTPSTSDVSISIATPRLPTAQPSTTKQSLQLSPSNGEGAVFPEYLLTLCSPFGNGWIDQLPRFITSQDFGSSDAPAIDQSSFAFRLLNNTLQNAYWSLTGETLEHITASHRIFRFALMYHSKDELLFNLRWFLGPGIAASQVLMQKSASATVSMGDDSRLLNPNVDLAAVEHSQSGSGFVSGAYESYLSVDEIDRYLRGRNARYIDFDTIELTFPLPAYAETTLNGSTPKDSSYVNAWTNPTSESLLYQQHGSLSDVFKAFDFNSLLHDSRRFVPEYHDDAMHETPSAANGERLGSSRRRIQVQALFRHLADISVCLVQGPAFHRRMLDEAINGSVINT